MLEFQCRLLGRRTPWHEVQEQQGYDAGESHSP
jgi:hypothetical protein